MQPHRIRLIGPWQYRWVTTITPIIQADSVEAISFPAWETTQMPQSWQELFGHQSGTAQFERRFQQPTNLESHERVAIVFDGIGGTGNVSLNHQPLGEIETSDQMQCFDITDCLQPSNLLTVEIGCDADFDFSNPAGLYDVVAIEISGEELIAEG